MQKPLLKKLTDTFFFSNIFAGLCAVALCIETNVQHKLSLNGIHFYTLIFFGTIYYYTFLYIKGVPANDLNERVTWYRMKLSVLKKSQNIILIFLLADALLFVWQYRQPFSTLNSQKIGLILLFPIVAFTYTYNVLPFPNMKKLKRIGWLKPFIIGFIWSGIVTVYPIIFYQLQVGNNASVFSFPSGLLWLKNLLFIATLSIMFDIKDAEDDKRGGLKTFPVQFGIGNTTYLIIMPLMVLGLLTYLMFAMQKNLPMQNITINSIPYILLMLSTYALSKKKSVIYHLCTIDGLMLVKAACGVAAVLLLK